MQRTYTQIIKTQFAEHQQMAFISGPRQVGKTTLALDIAGDSERHYLNWDDADHRELILGQTRALAAHLGLDHVADQLPVVVFDELHKYGRWKQFLKGFFDRYKTRCRILVTGSAHMTVYQRGGDSLMGRYFYYRLHPLSVAELMRPQPLGDTIAPPARIGDEDYNALLRWGGFPEPFQKQDRRFYTRWSRLREQQLLQEDVRDLTRVQELAQLEMLARMITTRSGSQLSYSSMARQVRVSVDTIRRWTAILESLYHCFPVRPWSKNVTRSLLKEPKYYLWDWAQCQDPGARAENFIACHLLKAVHYWTDTGLGEFGLHYLRDKDKREVDFLVSHDRKPWFLVEVKQADAGNLSSHLHWFQKQTGAPHAFQVVIEGAAVRKNLFDYPEPVIVPARSFLSQLV